MYMYICHNDVHALCVGVSEEVAIVEQAGRDIAADSGQPGGGAKRRDWLWQNHTGQYTPSHSFL